MTAHGCASLERKARRAVRQPQPPRRRSAYAGNESAAPCRTRGHRAGETRRCAGGCPSRRDERGSRAIQSRCGDSRIQFGRTLSRFR
jgi:hypothetical protein